MTPPHGSAAMNESLQVLWEDGERVFCRGSRPSAAGEQRAVLIVVPAGERPSPASLDRLAHEYELKDELDGAWAARPLELVREHGRTMLVLEDPGGEPLARLLGAPMEVGGFLRLAIGIAGALGKAHQRGLVHKDLKPAHILVNCADGRGAAHRLRHRLAAAARTTDARAARNHRRHAGLYGARTDRTDEPLDRFAQRPLFARRHVLSDAHGRAAVHRVRSDGVGPLPYREEAGAARRADRDCPGPAVSQIVMKLLAKTAEERYQTAAGVESDLRRCLAEWERRAPHRRLPARRTRHARPAADPREAVRERARGRDPARRLRPHRQERRAGAGAGLRLFRHRQVLRRQ